MARKKQPKRVENAKKNSMLGASAQYGTYRDIQRKAIVLGMPFPDVVSSDVGRLQSFIDKSNNEPDTSLIDKYDQWVDEQMALLDYEPENPMRSSKLRLGYIGETNEQGEAKRKRVRGIKKQREKKQPRERNEFNLYKGTKKAYVFELTQKGYTIERIQRRVLKKFPDAKEKSIKLWHTAAKRQLK